MFMGGDENRGKQDLGMLGKRQPNTLEINDPSLLNITMKHLIFFLENDPAFKGSKMLFKAYMSR